MPDFDFETKREFPTVGFASILDVWRFESIWKTPELQQELAAGIAAREMALLGAWALAGDGYSALGVGALRKRPKSRDANLAQVQCKLAQ